MKYLLLFILFFFPSSCLALCENTHSCILMDIDSGRILYSKNSNEKRLIASTTKMMTFLVAYENGNLNDVYEVGEEVLDMYGTSIYLSVGEKISLRDLLYGLILRSGNDASVVIAYNIGKNYDDFIYLMNKKAQDLGMKNTVFSNPHGLDEKTENYSTSYDMALLSRELSKIPFYLEVTSTKHYTTTSDMKAYDWYNRNKLLTQYKYATGGKNGYTPRAGKTLVSTAFNNNLSLTAVSLSDSDTYNTHISLYEDAFSKYENYLILNRNSFSYNDKNYGKLYIKNSFSYPVLEHEKELITMTIQIMNNVDINQSNKVGTVIVYLDKEEIHQEDLYAKKGKEKLSFFDRILLFFQKLF